MTSDWLILPTLLAAIGSGLIAGVFFAFSTFVMRALARLPADQAVAAMQSINVTILNPVFFAVCFGTALLSIVLIAGGRDKGGDFERLNDTVRRRVSHLILIGEAAPRLQEALRECRQISRAPSLQAAVEKAAEVAASGSIVLLSPACASFDMFADYQDRGRQFKALVNALPA